MDLVTVFIAGAIAGGVGAGAGMFLLGRPAKGRSVAGVLLPNRTANEVYQIASGYATSQRMRVTPMTNGLMIHSGSEWLAGARVIEVRARDTPTGCEVAVQAYLRSFYPKEVHLDPRQFYGTLPRRQLLRIAQGLLSMLGAGSVSFEHRRAA